MKRGKQPTSILIAVSIPLLLTFGYAFWGKEFATLGIPLPVHVGGAGVAYTAVKLYPFEIGLVLLTILAGIGVSLRQVIMDRSWFRSSRLMSLCLAILLVGFLRAIPDLIRGEWISVIRNSSFVWYLLLPVLLAPQLARPEGLDTLERGTRGLFAILALYFAYTVGIAFAYKSPLSTEWFPHIGIYFLLLWGIFSQRKYLPAVALIIMGLAFGISVYDRLQRTTMLGCTIAWLASPLLHRYLVKSPKFWWRWAIVVIAMPLGYFFLGADFQIDGQNPRDLSPIYGLSLEDQVTRSIRKAEAGSNGLERIRWTMWTDAFGEFESRPLTGIGFNAQVVKRVYLGDGQFAPNKGGFESAGAPPISGPHNSYLNALARMGILGTLFLVLHLGAIYVLIRARLFALACGCIGQAWYAVFNVGLEGPIRSSMILTSIGAAIAAERLAAMRNNPKS